MIILPCSCGKKGCPNKIRIYEQDKTILLDHKQGGTDMLMYSSTGRLRRFALAILKAFPDDRNRAQKP